MAELLVISSHGAERNVSTKKLKVDHGVTVSNDESGRNKCNLFPFFIIRRKIDGIRIDGIRDEVWFDPNGNEDDDIYSTECGGSWSQRPIIVECKHRVSSRPFVPPPFYEQIQATAYCFMYGVDHAEIIQVLRKQNKLKQQGFSNIKHLQGEVKNFVKGCLEEKQNPIPQFSTESFNTKYQMITEVAFEIQTQINDKNAIFPRVDQDSEKFNSVTSCCCSSTKEKNEHIGDAPINDEKIRSQKLSSN